MYIRQIIVFLTDDENGQHIDGDVMFSLNNIGTRKDGYPSLSKHGNFLKTQFIFLICVKISKQKLENRFTKVQTLLELYNFLRICI